MSRKLDAALALELGYEVVWLECRYGEGLLMKHKVNIQKEERIDG